MRRTKVIVAGLLLLAVVVAVLFYNKYRIAKRSEAMVLKAVPVSVVSVTKQMLRDTTTMVGTVSAASDVAIIAETAGRVVAVGADVGDYVRAGAVLVEVDDELKKAALATAEINREKVAKDLERFESLFKQSSATEGQVEAARLAAKAAEAQYITARRQYHDTKITTPIAGVVTSRPVDLGNYVQQGMAVANVVDIGSLKVKLNVAEKDVFRLKIGSGVEITTEVYPGVRYAGRVRTISAKADEAHTYPVEISLPNSREHPLKAGMFCRVGFTSLSGGNVLTIPRDALVGSLKQPQVYAVEGVIARLRSIVVGGESGTLLTVLAGLREGERVVVSGQNNLKDSVAVAVER